MSLSAFLDEDESESLNPHEIAWRMRDWDAVEELTKEYSVSKENLLFKILDKINNEKTPLNIASLDVYDKYYIDNAMSQHVDTLIYAYVMNLIGYNLTDQMHFNYYLETVRKARRTGSWAKLVEDGEEKVILRVLENAYSINTRTAMEYYDTLKELNKLDEWKRKHAKVALSVLGDVVKNKTDQKKVEKIIQKW